MLAGIDFDLQAHALRRHVLGLETIYERHSAFGLLPLRLAKPRVEHLVQRIHDRAGRSWRNLHEVDVLGVAGGRRQMELVERRAATERKLIGQERMREYPDQRPADDEILFDLNILDPRCPRPATR